MKKKYLEALSEARSYETMFNNCYFDDCYLEEFDSLALVVCMPFDAEDIIILYED